VEFSALGPIEVHSAGSRIPVGGVKQHSILALLVANRGRAVSADQIVEDIYGEEAPSRARRSVQSTVSMMRRDLGDVITSSGDGHMFEVPREAVDATRFEDGVAAGLEGLEARVEADLGCGRHREVLGELEALTVEVPLRERLWGLWMLALYRAGRQAEALGAYQQVRKVLGEQLGIEPSTELRVLEEQILLQDAVLDLVSPVPHNSPAPKYSSITNPELAIEAPTPEPPSHPGAAVLPMPTRRGSRTSPGALALCCCYC